MSDKSIEESLRENLREGILSAIVPDLVEKLMEVVDDFHGIDTRQAERSDQLRHLRDMSEQKARAAIAEDIRIHESEYRAQLIDELRRDMRRELLPIVRAEIRKELMSKLFVDEEAPELIFRQR